MIFYRNKAFYFQRFLFSGGVFGIISLFGHFTVSTLLIAFVPVVLVPSVSVIFIKSVKQLEITAETITVTYDYLLARSKVEISPSDVYLAFEQTVGSRGAVSNRLSLYEIKTRHRILSLGDSLDGWSYSNIYAIINSLKEIGVREEFR
ncbi:MAG TPA: hypothetical protein VK183_09990 [Flavobacterium sp.]|nr:hypothetical protein [Flavobacterium sp.]